MRPIPFDVVIAPPRNVRAARGLVAPSRTTIPELCASAGIPLRVTSATWQPVILHAGTDHFRTENASCVGVGRWKQADRTQALRALEVLAHGFHDYAARECICGRGFFVPPARLGRPPLGRSAMTAAERMRKMREARARARPSRVTASRQGRA